MAENSTAEHRTADEDKEAAAGYGLPAKNRTAGGKERRHWAGDLMGPRAAAAGESRGLQHGARTCVLRVWDLRILEASEVAVPASRERGD